GGARAATRAPADRVPRRRARPRAAADRGREPRGGAGDVGGGGRAARDRGHADGAAVAVGGGQRRGGSLRGTGEPSPPVAPSWRAMGDMRMGLLWLSEKRNDEEYSYEDLEFLGTLSRQLAAALGFARQAELLAETRQLESLNRLSSFVLHDIKNHVSGLSLVVE